MPSLDWIVKNGLNKDVERQHLNKILADIRSSVGTVETQVTTVTNVINSGGSSSIKDTVGDMVSGNIETGIDVTYDFQKKVLDFVVANFIIALAGDVTGEATVTGLGDTTIQTIIDPSLIGVPEAPIDNNAYWRRNAEWESVGESIQTLAELRGTGFPALGIDDFEPVWNLRTLVEPVEGITITNPAGEAGDPTFTLADDLAAVEGLTTTGLTARTAASTWTTRAVTQGTGIVVTDGDGVAGDPVVAHDDTSSVADLTSDNSGTVVIQDVTFTFDTFGHVLTATVGTVDVATALAGTYQPLDATLTALAGQNWVANAIPIGSGADAVAQVAFAANTFPARGSTGNLVSKPVTDNALLLLGDADVPRLSTNNIWVGSTNNFSGTINVSGAVVGGPATRTESAAPAYQWRTETGIRRWRIQYVATDATDGVFRFSKWNGAAFVDKVQVDANDDLSIIGGGRLHGSALHNNALGLAGTTEQYVGSGTYTPTLTNVTNIAASTAYVCQFMRVGNVVTVSGRVDIDITTASIACELGISLPIASTLSTDEQCSGVAASHAVASLCGRVSGDIAANRAQLRWIATADVANRAWSFTFTYLVS